MKIERCEKGSFVVIGKEGSTLDGALYVFSNQKAVKELLNSGRRICFID